MCCAGGQFVFKPYNLYSTTRNLAVLCKVPDLTVAGLYVRGTGTR